MNYNFDVREVFQEKGLLPPSTDPALLYGSMSSDSLGVHIPSLGQRPR